VLPNEELRATFTPVELTTAMPMGLFSVWFRLMTVPVAPTVRIPRSRLATDSFSKRTLPIAVDVLECDRCSGPMRILAAIHPPEAVRKILECLGLPSRAPPIARAVPEDADGPE